MAKEYRLHTGQTGSGWFNSTPISPENISDIAAVNNDAKKLATSIPSPFARIDLVKTAFKYVADSNIKGQSNNHKLVSDALDVAQLFFNFKNVKNQYPNSEIIAWDPATDINDLLKDSSSKAYGETINLFWNQDGEAYNFNKASRIFILKVNYAVIGGTSPATLFFAAPDVHGENISFNFGNVKLFDSQYESLVERDDEFTKFMYALSKQSNFAKYFKEVSDYLDACLLELHAVKPDLWNEVQGFSTSSLKALYQPLQIVAGNQVEVLNIPICESISNTNLIESRSGFTIESTLAFEGPKPLVLPVVAFYEDRIYTTDIWDSTTKVPESDLNPLELRTLPNQGEQYPYLTMGDFFEDNLISLPYELNDNKFLTLGFKKHLIPLKPLVFKYFSVDDLVNKNMLSVNENVAGGGVNVKLTIPTSVGSITYSKTYIAENTIYKREFHCGIYPMLHSEGKNIQTDYHVGLIDAMPNNSLRLDFWRIGEKNSIQNVSSKERAKKSQTEYGRSLNYLLLEKFDYIIMSDDASGKGLIIPLFKHTTQGAQKCFVAIDFGTTNTHIEYRYEGAIEKPFDISDVFGSLISESANRGAWEQAYHRILTSELYPEKIGNDAICYFPLRTALVENKDTVQNISAQSFLDSNVAYYYERINSRTHHSIRTDFKWGNMTDETIKNRVKQFIEQLVEGIKNKLLMDNVSPRNLFITWLYPVSMTMFQRNQLSALWKDVVQNKIGEIKGLRSIPESIAPFIYHAKNTGLLGLTASIDIGGGSSDISIFDEDKPQIISSVNFAGNAVLGDGYNNSIRNNGFVKTFDALFKERCKNKKNSELTSILHQIIHGVSPSSSNFSSFLFSVPKDVFNYNEEITNNGRLKLLYIIFYAAQAYYLAKLMNKKGFEFPKNIIFSGSGSKSISIIDNTDNLEVLQEMFEFIFSEVYNKRASNIKIKPSENPKEITCKGALADVEGYDKVPTGFWMGGTLPEFDCVISNSQNEETVTYDSISSELKNDILRSVKTFYSTFDNYIKGKDLNDLFGIEHDVISIFKSEREELLLEFLNKGLQAKVKESGTSDKYISEGLFFYPLVGMLNSLGVKLVKA